MTAPAAAPNGGSRPPGSPGKSLRTFDFDANPAVIHTLATCDWVKKSLPLCLIGDSGTGKYHLLIALGTEAAMAGYRSATPWPPSSSTSWSKPPRSEEHTSELQSLRH